LPEKHMIINRNGEKVIIDTTIYPHIHDEGLNLRPRFNWERL